jgi:hypothetical protein
MFNSHHFKIMDINIIKDILTLLSEQNAIIEKLIDSSYRSAEVPKFKGELPNIDISAIPNSANVASPIDSKLELKLDFNSNLKELIANTNPKINIKSKLSKYILREIKNIPIVITSTQSPGNGGSATNCYNIHKWCMHIGLNVMCAFFVNDDSKIVDPENIGNVIRIDRSIFTPEYARLQFQPWLEKYNYDKPVLCLCKNYWTPSKMKIIFPGTNIVYLVSGSKHITTYLKTNAIAVSEIISNGEIKQLSNNKIVDEIETIGISDYMLCNSSLSCDIMNQVYTDSKFECLFTTDISACLLEQKYTIVHDFKSRNIDVLYCVSNFDRIIKGPSKMIEIATQLSTSYNIVMIGNNSIKYRIHNRDNITYLDQQSNLDVLKYMYNSKVVVIPSLYEACPNTLYEAICMGSNIVLSENIGSYERFKKSSIVNNYHDTDEWVSVIENNLTEFIDHDLDYNIVGGNILKLIYEINTNIEYKSLNIDIKTDSFIYLGYDMIKFIPDIFTKLEAINKITPFKIILPDAVRASFSSNCLEKYNTQLYSILHKHKKDLLETQLTDIGISDLLSEIQKNIKNTIVFTTHSKIKIVNTYFPNFEITSKIINLFTTTKSHVVFQILSADEVPDILKLVQDLINHDPIKSIVFISSLGKPV